MEPTVIPCVQCGARLRLPAASVAKRFKCPKCGASNSVEQQAAPPAPAANPPPVQPSALARPAPAPAKAPEPHFPPPPRSGFAARPSVATQNLAALQSAAALANKSKLRPLRWVFLLAILPLALDVFSAPKARPDPDKVEPAFEQKLQERLAARPELQERLAKLAPGVSFERLSVWGDAFESAEFNALLTMTKSELLPRLEESDQHRLLDALSRQFMLKYSGLLPPPFLPKDTWGHWGFAAVAAVLFLAYFCFAYPRGSAKIGHLFGIGVLTGTVGILLLFAVQFLAGIAQNFRVRGFGLLTLIWVLLFVVGFSYEAADAPENGFILSFLGFTVGVGLLEELCKLLPLIWHFRRGGDLDWRGACVWGLVSGAGFGISEGIMYSARYYNGHAPLGTYLLRFVSCVAMHAAWAGAAGILLFRRQDALRGELSRWDWILVLAPVLAVPMVLHGLYDTLLKMDMDPWALLVGVASFVFFVWLQESEARNETGRSMRLMGIGR